MLREDSRDGRRDGQGQLARTLLIAMGGALFCLATAASAQNSLAEGRDLRRILHGLAPNGWGDLDYKINNIPNAFDASNTYYLPKAHNLGLLLDGSGHFKGGTTPPNLQNGSNDSTGVGYALGGCSTNSTSTQCRRFSGAWWVRRTSLPIAATARNGAWQRAAAADWTLP